MEEIGTRMNYRKPAYTLAPIRHGDKSFFAFEADFSQTGCACQVVPKQSFLLAAYVLAHVR